MVWATVAGSNGFAAALPGAAELGLGHGIAGHEKFDVEYTLLQVRPDIIVDGRSIPQMRQNPVYQQAYVRVPGWRFSEVVVRRY